MGMRHYDCGYSFEGISICCPNLCLFAYLVEGCIIGCFNWYGINVIMFFIWSACLL